MLTVYTIPVSLYSAKLRILLRHKGLNWNEIPPPGGYASDEYKTIVPSGNLPALLDGDLQIADSEAIAEYLDQAHPKPAMLPRDRAAKAKVRERSRFHDTRLEPAVRALFGYLPGRGAAPEGVLTVLAQQITARLAQFGQMLGDTPKAGEKLTLGDCGYPITFAWLDELAPRMGLDLRWTGPVTVYRARVDALPSVAEELVDYRPKLRAFLDGEADEA